MIGPTGVGKTEISRRMARITDAPFVKVEATKYTEVGFKGKDVDTILEELYTAAKTKARRRLEKDRLDEAQKIAHDVVFSAITRQFQEHANISFDDYRTKFESGELDKIRVVIDISVTPQDPMKGQFPVEFLLVMPEKRKIRQTVKKPLREAFELTKNEALQKLVDDAQVNALGKELAESEGIVFVDEIDKVVCEANSWNADVSSLGVQQDLLPLLEGSSVPTKDGTMIVTDNILFICSGAFHNVKPSDMIAELQGRLPVRVELQPLSEKEFRRILLEPKYSILVQQRALMRAENIDLQFSEDAVDALAASTAEINRMAQDIGARRLHTVIERVMDDYSFNCDDFAGKTVEITAEIVRNTIKPLLQKVDLAKYLL